MVLSWFLLLVTAWPGRAFCPHTNNIFHAAGQRRSSSSSNSPDSDSDAPATPFAQEQPPVLNEVRRKRAATIAATIGKPPTAVEDLVTSLPVSLRAKGAAKPASNEEKLLFPELGQAGLDEKVRMDATRCNALVSSPLPHIARRCVRRHSGRSCSPSWTGCFPSSRCDAWHGDNRWRPILLTCPAPPRPATPRHATPRHATPRHTTPHHTTPRHARSPTGLTCTTLP